MVTKAQAGAAAYDATVEVGPPVETDDPDGYLRANRIEQADAQVASAEQSVAKAEAQLAAAEAEHTKAKQEAALAAAQETLAAARAYREGFD